MFPIPLSNIFHPCLQHGISFETRTIKSNVYCYSVNDLTYPIMTLLVKFHADIHTHTHIRMYLFLLHFLGEILPLEECVHWNIFMLFILKIKLEQMSYLFIHLVCQPAWPNTSRSAYSEDAFSSLRCPTNIGDYLLLALNICLQAIQRIKPSLNNSTVFSSPLFQLPFTEACDAVIGLCYNSHLSVAFDI